MAVVGFYNTEIAVLAYVAVDVLVGASALYSALTTPAVVWRTARYSKVLWVAAIVVFFGLLPVHLGYWAVVRRRLGASPGGAR